MDVEVVAAGRAAKEFGNDGDEGGEEDDERAGEALEILPPGSPNARDPGHPDLFIFIVHFSRLCFPSVPCSLFPSPCFYGSSRSV